MLAKERKTSKNFVKPSKQKPTTRKRVPTRRSDQRKISRSESNPPNREQPSDDQPVACKKDKQKKGRSNELEKGAAIVAQVSSQITIKTENRDSEIDDVPERYNSITVQNAIVNWATKTINKGVGGLVAEFKPSETTYPQKLTASFHANEEANRYVNTVCLEATRVKVKDGVPNDYIHANYVLMNSGSRKPKFICAQGPMENTVDQFWRMIVQEHVECIIMLCDFIEKKQPKCAPYYPTELNEPKSYGNIIVKLLGRTETDSFKPTRIIVTLLNVNDHKTSVNIRHFHWVSWPDHGVPNCFIAPLRLFTCWSTTTSPILIHCSAGVGRTGTLTLFATAYDILLKGCNLEMEKQLVWLREQRAHSVQNDMQYIYIHRVLLELAYKKDCIAKETLDEFIKQYNQYINKQKRKKNQRKKEISRENPRSMEHKLYFHQ